MSIFSRYNKPKEVEPLVLTTAHRRGLIRKAMLGASVYEQRSLVREAFDCLGPTERKLLVRELDREIWSEEKA